jgi:ACS family hexuronate transporter-like MFS transporter
MTWHFLRAWLPLYLQERHKYGTREVQLFASAYYICTDLGALSAGFATLWLARRGVSVGASRRLVFVVCALLAALGLAVVYLPKGPVLLLSLLVVGFGSLGVFPNYYSFSQDLTVRHQGKLTGTLGCCCWAAMACWQELIGQLVEGKGWVGNYFFHGHGSYTPCFVIAALAPLVGFLALVLLWGPAEAPAPLPAAEAPAGEQVLVAAQSPAEEGIRPG